MKLGKFCTQQREQTEFGCNLDWLQRETQQSPGETPNVLYLQGKKLVYKVKDLPKVSSGDFSIEQNILLQQKVVAGRTFVGKMG